MTQPETLRGVKIYRQFLGKSEQQDMVSNLRDVVGAAPLFSPMTPYGKPMKVKMTSAGQFGWFSDRSGYSYKAQHPSGVAWPEIPQSVLDVWQAVGGTDRDPECCLVNYYDDTAKMGLHQDKDEADFAQPVVSISLGNSGLFRIGNATRGGSTQSTWLHSGDVLVMAGEARLLFHGIDRIKPQSSDLLRNGGRINLTLRVVT